MKSKPQLLAVFMYLCVPQYAEVNPSYYDVFAQDLVRIYKELFHKLLVASLVFIGNVLLPYIHPLSLCAKDCVLLLTVCWIKVLRLPLIAFLPHHVQESDLRSILRHSMSPMVPLTLRKCYVSV